MEFRHILNALSSLAPGFLQESWDNSGLQIVAPEDNCTGILLCVDVTDEIISEAAVRGCNLVVSHHPLIFKGLKSLTGRTVAERAAVAAIKAGVAVYSAHTSLDSAPDGISYCMARMLGLDVLGVLHQSEARMVKVDCICSRDRADDLCLALLDGSVHSTTSMNVEEDHTTFEENSLTVELTHIPLTRVELTLPAARLGEIRAIISSLPFRAKIASVSELTDNIPAAGLGVVGQYSAPKSGEAMLDLIKATFGCAMVRANNAMEHLVASEKRAIQRVALCGGAGGEFIPDAIRSRADLYISADIRYHDFAEYRATGDMALVDVGHYESEKCAKDIFYNFLKNKFHDLPVLYSQGESNPVNYL